VKPFEAFKISILGGLLLIIFSLPMLTATQLVGVLGTSSLRTSLKISAYSDLNTFTTVSGTTFDISFQGPHLHQFAIVNNPADKNKTLLIQVASSSKVPPGLTLVVQEKALSRLNLQQYNSSVGLTIGPRQTVPLAIDSRSADPDHGTIILSLIED
jgi:hypothetical protein